jgi:AraC-like DNA-binding protein
MSYATSAQPGIIVTLMTPLQPSHVSEAYFPALAARHPNSAAAFLPLVMWQDTIDPQSSSLAHQHRDFFSLYLVRQGRGTHVIDGVPYAVARGDVYAMGVGQTHWFTDCDSLCTDTLHFSPDIFDGPTLETLSATPGFQSLFVEEPLRRHENGGRWLHLTPEQHDSVERDLTELREEWNAGTPDGTLLTQALFLRLLIRLARCYASSPGPLPDVSSGATVAAAVRYFDAHFTEPVRIADVAARVFLSPDRFTEVFSSAMGRTPRDYLGHLRLERAKRLLTTTDLPISEVGIESGFGDAAYFTRTFRQATGRTPRAFRAEKDF